MQRLLISFILLIYCGNLSAQQEYILGKSANTFYKGEVMVGAYFVRNTSPIPASANRVGVEFGYGLTDRIIIGIQGSGSSFLIKDFAFETANLKARYRFLKTQKQTFSFFLEASGISNLSFSSGDIDFDGNNAGYGFGFINTHQFKKMTLSISGEYAKIAIPKFIDGLLDGYGLLYTVSANRLLTPTNPSIQFSLLAELIGQYNTEIGTDNFSLVDRGTYLDWLIGGQITFNRKYRLEVAFQDQVYTTITRLRSGFFHLRFKYLLPPLGY